MGLNAPEPKPKKAQDPTGSRVYEGYQVQQEGKGLGCFYKPLRTYCNLNYVSYGMTIRKNTQLCIFKVGEEYIICNSKTLFGRLQLH